MTNRFPLCGRMVGPNAQNRRVFIRIPCALLRRSTARHDILRKIQDLPPGKEKIPSRGQQLRQPGLGRSQLCSEA